MDTEESNTENNNKILSVEELNIDILPIVYDIIKR